MITKDGLQLFDIEKGIIDRQRTMSASEHGVIYDVLEANNSLYIATASGIFDMPLQQKHTLKGLNNHLVYTIINNKDTLFSKGATLPYHKNNIQFHLSTPSFKRSQAIYYKYRLKHGNQNEWLRTTTNEKSIHYAALMPGKYIFEAMAFGLNGESAQKPVTFTFTILNPWWKQWWFIGLVFLGVVAILAAMGRLYYFFNLRKERENFEKKLAVEMERQRIGAEIHDDISAGLSALRLQMDVLETKTTSASVKEQLLGMHENVTSLSLRMREVIWTLNTEYDSLENLIYYLHQQGVLFFSKTGIAIYISLPEHIPDQKIDGERRRNIYLIIKESFQNIVKHAQASSVKMDIVIESHRLYIKVHDNGIGLSSKTTVESSGFRNMNRRAKALNGKIDISSDQGTRVIVMIPID